MMIGETNFNEKSTFNMQGYTCYRKDRITDTYGGGVLLLVNNNLPSEEVEITTTDLEAVAAKINGTVYVSAYLPPKKIIKNSELDVIFNSANSVLIVGDLNAKHQNWNCQRGNQSGKILNEYMNTKAYVILATDDPTHFPYNPDHIPSVIDVALHKGIKNCYNIETVNELFSDHIPIKITIKNAEIT